MAARRKKRANKQASPGKGAWLEKARRITPWALLGVIVVSVVLFFALPSLHKPGFMVVDKTCVCGAAYRLRLDYPTYLTLGMSQIVTATLTDREGTLHMYVPFQSNALVQPLQDPHEWCNLLPNTNCILQWAVKATVPGDISFHVLPTFKSDDPTVKVRYQRWNIRLGSITAGDSEKQVIVSVLETAKAVFWTLVALLAVVQAILVILGRRNLWPGA